MSSRTPAETVARAALAEADTILPASRVWWEATCHRGHDSDAYDTEEDARSALGDPCNRDSCGYTFCAVRSQQVPARRRSSAVSAECLRTALAILDAERAENTDLRALVAEAHALFARSVDEGGPIHMCTDVLCDFEACVVGRHLAEYQAATVAGREP